MKQLLLILAAGLCAASAAAQPATSATQRAAIADPVQVNTPVVLSAKQLGPNHIMQTVKDATGFQYKRLVKTDNPNVPIKTMRTASRIRANAEGQGLREDFEGSDGSKNWQPQGWKVESKVASAAQPWAVTAPFSMLTGWNGALAEMCDLSEKPNDEWLYSAPVKVEAGNKLQFLAWFDLLFGVDFSYLDMETFEFTEWHPSQDLIVWAKEEGATDWVKLKDFFDECDGKTFDELFDLYTGEFQKFVLDLTRFEGKTITVGFQYVGANGNGCGIDDVLVGMPEYEAAYQYPDYTMFFGVAKDLSGLGTTIPVLPTYAPITWANTTPVIEGTDPTFSWIYYDADSQPAMVEARDLTVTYHPDYTSEFTTGNNIFYSPVLVAEADGWSPATYSVFDYFQVGGKADYPLETGTKSFGMSVCDAATEGYTYSLGSWNNTNVPMYGYDANTQAMWTTSFFGQNDGKKYSKVVAVFNYIDAPDSPMVINGCWTHAYVQGIKADAEFTLTICPLTDEGFILEPIATATLKGSQVGAEGAAGDWKSLTFKFDRPVVMSTDICRQYIIRLTGFEGAADYFAPLQSFYGAYNGVNHGFIEFEVYDGSAKTPSTYPLDYFANYTQAFGFNLDAVYPWLEGDSDVRAEIGATATAKLDSYYDASELTVTTSDPAIIAQVTGKHADCAVAISSANAEIKAGTVTLTAPGVSHTIAVQFGQDGIATAKADTGAAEIYDLQGRRMAGTDLPAGIYIRRTPTATQKITIK